MTVKCVSATGRLICINKDDFMKLSRQTETWNTLVNQVSMKKKLVKDKINLQNKARSDFSYVLKAPKDDPQTSR